MQYGMTLREMGGVSLIHPFWNDEKRLELQVQEWARWSNSACQNVDITLIDDHSDAPLELTSSQEQIIKDKDLSLSIYRILDDLKWNTPGSLNLGFTVAPKPWALTMDSDCFFDSQNWDRLLEFKPRDDCLHKFNRKRFGATEASNWLENTRYLPCTILLHKKIFWAIGGFDEQFTGGRTGGYGFFDNEFDWRADKRGWPMDIVPDIVAGEWLPSISGDPVFPGITKGEKDHEPFHKINRQILRGRQLGEIEQEREILRFRWELTYASR